VQPITDKLKLNDDDDDNDEDDANNNNNNNKYMPVVKIYVRILLLQWTVFKNK